MNTGLITEGNWQIHDCLPAEISAAQKSGSNGDAGI